MEQMKRSMVLAIGACVLVLVAACGPGSRGGGDDTGGDDQPPTCPVCSEDKSAVIDCEGNATACPLDQACNAGQCMNACEAAEKNHSSVGCDYYAVDMDAADGPPRDACYTVFVANTSPAQVHIEVEWNGLQLNLAEYAKLPVGTGQNITYAPFDPVAGLAPGKVAILFLAYAPAGGPLMGNVELPGARGGRDRGADRRQRLRQGVPHHDRPAGRRVPDAAVRRRARGGDRRVAAAADQRVGHAVRRGQRLRSAAGTGAADPGRAGAVVQHRREGGRHQRHDPPEPGDPRRWRAPGRRREPALHVHAQRAASTRRSRSSTGCRAARSPRTSRSAMFGGHQIMSIDRCCGDHGEQMLAPVRALGYEYVAAPHADRKPHPGRGADLPDLRRGQRDPPRVRPAGRSGRRRSTRARSTRSAPRRRSPCAARARPTRSRCSRT